MRKKHPEHVNLERWLVSYADFITLLFAFFVIMYAISQADLSKFRKLSQGMRTAFNGAGEPGGAGMSPFNDAGGSATGGVNPASGLESAPGPRLQEVRDLLEETVNLEAGLGEAEAAKTDLIQDSQGLIVRVAAKDFFGDGEIEVREDLRPLLDRIGRVLAQAPHVIRIEGHADSEERVPPGMTSLWELSAARAAWVVRYWVRRFDLNPVRLGIAGYADHRPLSRPSERDVSREWGRAKNRRVEIVILNGSYPD